jgi:hypothetical protein
LPERVGCQLGEVVRAMSAFTLDMADRSSELARLC